MELSSHHLHRLWVVICRHLCHRSVRTSCGTLLFLCYQSYPAGGGPRWGHLSRLASSTVCLAESTSDLSLASRMYRLLAMVSAASSSTHARVAVHSRPSTSGCSCRLAAPSPCSSAKRERFSTHSMASAAVMRISSSESTLE